MRLFLALGPSLALEVCVWARRSRYPPSEDCLVAKSRVAVALVALQAQEDGGALEPTDEAAELLACGGVGVREVGEGAR